MTSARFGQLASLLPECTSTQDIVRAAGAFAPEGFVAVTDHQTAGRGRRGRTWQDRPGQALMFSMLLRPTTAPDALAPLTLVAAIAVAEALPLTARIRWPNDVVVGGSKIAGLIAELEAPPQRDPYVILGIGINANTPAAALPETERLPATSLQVELGAPVDRLWLLHLVIDRLQAAYREFEALGFGALHDRYAALDDLAGRTVQLATGEGVVTGTGEGVDEVGRLVLTTDSGSRAFEAGEVMSVTGS
jgi:BirA family transcriptional regulator, biotin operon repressor / biotin---[acetyl-CoA-carboxylase] ligase